MGCTYPIPTLAKLFHLVRASSGNMRTQVVKELNYLPPPPGSMLGGDSRL